MILIFDLDDTLYDESDFVESGIQTVSSWLGRSLGVPPNECFHQMMNILDQEGRGKVFDKILRDYEQFSATMVARCVKVYRQHIPKIELYPEAKRLLKDLADKPLYLVTDGHKIVQANKVSALALWPVFRKVFITHRYGIIHAKPSLYCFRKIKTMESCDWNDLVYVGDNPEKDFVNLNKKGVHTVRLLQGHYRNVVAKNGFDAVHRIENLDDFSKLNLSL